MKLTNRTKEVISRMRDGYFIYVNKVATHGGHSLSPTGKYYWGSIHGNLVKHLIASGLIELEEFQNQIVEKYRLSELGKTIQL